jgi:two-component system, NtrC family, sensor kinase
MTIELKISRLEKDIAEEKDPIKKTNVLNQLSFELRHRERERSALLAEEALKLAEEKNNLKGIADSLANIGFNHIQFSRNEKALECLYKSIQFYQEIKNSKEIAFPLYMMGLENIRLSEFKAALEFLLESSKISDAAGDKLQEEKSLAKIAMIYSKFNDVENALSYAMKSLAYSVELGDKEHEGYVCMVIADIYILAQDFINSKPYLDRSLALRLEIGPLETAITYSAFGRWYQNQNMFEEALACHLKLTETVKTVNNLFAETRALINIAICYKKLNKMEEAEQTLKKALSNSETVRSKEMILEAHKILSEIYKHNNNSGLALLHYEKFHEMKEQVMNTEAANRLNNVQVMNKLESARKDAEIEKLRNVELKNANDELDRKNQELRETIDELTKAKISKLAITFTLILAVGLFVLSEVFLDPLVDTYSRNIWVGLSAKLFIAILLKPIESFMEKMMINIAMRRKKVVSAMTQLA